jgi:enoyl-CoA hydratase/carnithine racemase
MSGLVSVREDDGVAVVLLDNPPVNALGNAAIDALADAGDRLAADDSVRAVVLGGVGDRAFAAGADLEEFSGALGDRGWIEDHTARVRRMLHRWETLPQPVVAAVQASAMGGGLELLLVCDLVVSDPASQFSQPEVKLGLMPGAGATQRLPRRIGLGPAKELLLLGAPIDAVEARRLGLVNRISAPGAALAEAREIATQLARYAPASVRAIKQSVGNGTWSDDEGLDGERALFMDMFVSADAREGVDAFVEKRRPIFGQR